MLKKKTRNTDVSTEYLIEIFDNGYLSEYGIFELLERLLEERKSLKPQASQKAQSPNSIVKISLC